ncbi:bifunctional phosphopantothenoylcysteine decarboxylase/phosphopantothenate--cysteine ligase CoaBC [soil metagenome]
MRLSGKQILLGISGSISAYKSAEICRLLTKEGASVRVIMTSSAAEFISPLTLSTLSKYPVGLHMVNQDQTWNNHVELGLWGQLFLIAPASAHTIAKMAGGVCDNLLVATYLSARCPVLIAPAMDHDMFVHPATQNNLELLKKRGNLIVGPAYGELASGLTGEGRLEEPAIILNEVLRFFNDQKALSGKKILVTAGPTREAIDPVRFISNHSSGKMGVAIAKEFANQGALVTLVAGPIHLEIPQGIIHIPVESASEMKAACMSAFQDSDIIVMSAAVADYSPKVVSDQKVKKKDSAWNLEMTKTVDILSEMGSLKKANQILVGFALETENEIENAQRKLNKKNLDIIVLNSLNDQGAGFGTDTNKIRIIDKNNKVTEFPLKTKTAVAIDIVAKIIELSHA